MRIAQIAPLYERVPPRLYGGTERVVAHLCNGLVDNGHEVTLFACSESNTKADLYVCRDQAIRLDPDPSWDVPTNITQLLEVRKHINDFDILHFHTGVLQFPLFADVSYKTLTTMHGRQDIKDLPPLYEHYKDFPLVSISNNQREPAPYMKWMKTIYHGYPLDQYRFTKKPQGDYLAFLGRVSPEKGVDKAIEIAGKANLPLHIAAKIDSRSEILPTNRAYYDEHVKPILDDHPEVEFIGEIDEEEKSNFLGNALATLFPVSAPEAFGLVMIESFACGTPVIAFNKGSIPEVVDDGLTGWVVENVDEAVEACVALDLLDRREIRDTFERRFSSNQMVRGYEQVYKELLGV